MDGLKVYLEKCVEKCLQWKVRPSRHLKAGYYVHHIFESIQHLEIMFLQVDVVEGSD